MHWEPLEPKKTLQSLLQMMSWLYAQNPVLIPSENLHALSSRLTSIPGKDYFNWEQARSVAKFMQNKLEITLFNKALFKRPLKLESLFQRFLKYEEKIVNLNAVQQSHNDFELDLTPDPLAMLKDEMLEKPGKRSLRKVVMLEKNLIQKEEIFKLSGTVPGGAALLRSVRWSKGAKLSA